MSTFNNTVLCLAVAVMPVLAFAQQKPRSDPADAAAPVPAMSYDSAFKNYIPDREIKPAGWKEVNEEVSRIGGHAGLTRGATGGAGRPAVPGGKPAGKPSAQPDKPASNGHSGHPK